MKIQGNLDIKLKNLDSPTKERNKKNNFSTNKNEKTENEDSHTCAPSPCPARYTKYIDAFDDVDSLSLAESHILSDLIRCSYFQGTRKVKVSLSRLQKRTKIKKRSNLLPHLEELEKMGYFVSSKKPGCTNIYNINVEKIEKETKINLNDYYPGYKDKVK